MKSLLLSPHRFIALLPLVGTLALSPALHAVPVPATDATYTGAFTAGSPENITGDAAISSITIPLGTFSNLVGANANNVVAQQVPSSVGTAPADSTAATTGLSANDGANNLQSGNFQFTLGFLTANTRIFILESTPTTSTIGDPTTVILIDASNTQVGSFTLSLVPADFTSSAANNTSNALATLNYTSGVASLTGGVQSKLGATTFALTDFTGTGDATLATGIKLTSASQLDPNVVGTFAVPEPGTWSMLLGGLGILGGYQRIRSRRR